MFRSQTNEKIGNLLNYLASRIPNLSMTKALKLLYLIDETAYQRTGVPVTWLDYQVWEMGPVAGELYEELRNGRTYIQHNQPLSLEPYIGTEKKDNPDQTSYITLYPVGKADLSVFSLFEQELINNIIDRFGSYTAKQLINLLHEEDTLWHQLVQEKDLKRTFSVYGKKSNHAIDFSVLIKNDPILQMAARSAYESMQLEEDLNQL